MKKLTIFLLVFILLISPVIGLSKIGVGVGVGKIEVTEPLKPGQIYDLPSLPVLNTGDETADYEVVIEYHQDQETKTGMGLKPVKEWFSFEPQSFSLKPGKVKNVVIKLTLPLKVRPGNYFAYLEAHPVKKSETGGASIGVAAASKLYFTVAPANIIQGLYYRIISLYAHYHPWDTIVLLVICLAILLRFFSKRFKFQVTKK